MLDSATMSCSSLMVVLQVTILFSVSLKFVKWQKEQLQFIVKVSFVLQMVTLTNYFLCPFDVWKIIISLFHQEERYKFVSSNYNKFLVKYGIDCMILLCNIHGYQYTFQ